MAKPTMRQMLEATMGAVREGEGVAFRLKTDTHFGPAINLRRITSVGDEACVLDGKTVIKYVDLWGVRAEEIGVRF